MARLRSLRPGLVQARPVLSAPSDEAVQDRRRDEGQPWRAWYKTARWQRLKTLVHVRDGYACQATGVLCIGLHPAGNSPVADHVVSPAEVWQETGDLAAVALVFWDKANLRTVSKAWHDGPRQSGQRRARGGGVKSSQGGAG